MICGQIFSAHRTQEFPWLVLIFSSGPRCSSHPSGSHHGSFDLKRWAHWNATWIIHVFLVMFVRDTTIAVRTCSIVRNMICIRLVANITSSRHHPWLRTIKKVKWSHALHSGIICTTRWCRWSVVTNLKTNGICKVLGRVKVIDSRVVESRYRKSCGVSSGSTKYMRGYHRKWAMIFRCVLPRLKFMGKGY